MTRFRTQQSSFTAGEIAPSLHGRTDLAAYANGAAELTNVLVAPTGGVSRRPGLRHCDRLDGPVRLVPFEFNTEQTYLLAIGDGRTAIYRGDNRTLTLPTPWTAADLPELAWTQSADTLLVCHPDRPPQRIGRFGAADWRCAPWAFPVEEEGRSKEPFHRFVDDGVTLTPDGTAGTVTLTASAPVFTPAHRQTRLRLTAGARTVQAVVTAVPAPRSVRAELSADLPDTEPIRQWEEAAWSPAHGWPATAAFHQSRLVVGGSRDLPNRLWLSAPAGLFDFDLAQGADDAAIDLALLSDQVNAIRAVVSARDLLVLTSGAEWEVTGEPLTPSSVTVREQTRIGSRTDRKVPPVIADGAVLFASRDGRALRELRFTDLEQAYQATDLTLLAGHLARDPVDQAYWPAQRLLLQLRPDGTAAALAAYRVEQVTAWTRLVTDGQFRAVATVGTDLYVAVERKTGDWRLERFDPGLGVDAGHSGRTADPVTRWSGLDVLDGDRVRVLADGIDIGRHRVRDGAIAVPVPARTVSAGLAFAHAVEPLPPALPTGEGPATLALRPVETVFAIEATPALTVDTGRGPRPLPLRRLAGVDAPLDAGPAPVTGMVRHRHLGWTRNPSRPLWRLTGDAPLPFTLLAAATELKVND